MLATHSRPDLVVQLEVAHVEEVLRRDHVKIQLLHAVDSAHTHCDCRGLAVPYCRRRQRTSPLKSGVELEFFIVVDFFLMQLPPPS